MLQRLCSAMSDIDGIFGEALMCSFSGHSVPGNALMFPDHPKLMNVLAATCSVCNKPWQPKETSPPKPCGIVAVKSPWSQWSA